MGKDQVSYLFTGRRDHGRPITTRQYARLLGAWVTSIGLDSKVFGTHSLRQTKATLIYRRTGNLRAVQLLLGHTKIESTDLQSGPAELESFRFDQCDRLGFTQILHECLRCFQACWCRADSGNVGDVGL